MECSRCSEKMTELEALSEEVLSFFKKEDGKEKDLKFSINIGDSKIGDDIIHGTVDKAYYCENCGEIIAKIKKEDF